MLMMADYRSCRYEHSVGGYTNPSPAEMPDTRQIMDISNSHPGSHSDYFGAATYQRNFDRQYQDMFGYQPSPANPSTQNYFPPSTDYRAADEKDKSYFKPNVDKRDGESPECCRQSSSDDSLELLDDKMHSPCSMADTDSCDKSDGHLTEEDEEDEDHLPHVLAPGYHGPSTLR